MATPRPTEVDYRVERGRAEITLARPERRNALSPTMLDELRSLLWEADNDTSVHAIAIRGAGPDFCAGYAYPGGRPVPGADPDATYRGATELDDDMWSLEHTQRKLLDILDVHKPVIAVVHGRCLAGGTDLALLCDMVLATDDARIGFPATRTLGSPPMHLWLYHVGPQWSKRLLLTGDVVSGADAARIGLVLKALPADQLDGEVDGLLDRLALIDPHLLAAQKRIVNLGLELMGARTLQRLAAETDARAHHAPGAVAAMAGPSRPAERAAAWRERFGSGRARVGEADHFDGHGRLVDRDGT